MTDDPTPRCRYAGQTSPRVIPGRHDGTCNPETCPGCQPCRARHCIVCGKEHVTEQTCPDCLAAVRDDLRSIGPLTRGLLIHAFMGGAEGRLEAARPIPGGEATVLLSPGSDGRARVWARERGDDVTHAQDESHADPVPPLVTLVTWEDDWRHVIGHEKATEQATIRNTSDYLDANLDYAAQRHDAFDLFAQEMRHTRSRLESVLHAGDRDDKAGISCFDCGGQLVRKMTPTGMADQWTCKRCRRAYTDPEYNLAVRAKIEGAAS